MAAVRELQENAAVLMTEAKTSGQTHSAKLGVAESPSPKQPPTHATDACHRRMGRQPMFNLSEIIQNAQDGKAIDNLAGQFGITPEQAQAAVQAIIPAISAGLLQKIGQPGALGSIISAITDSAHQASFANPEAAQSETAAQKGNDVVNDIFGSNHIAQQIAQQVSNVTGLRSDLIMQMLPVVVSIALGGLAKAAQNQGWSGMLGQLTTIVEQGNLGGAAGQSSGIVGTVIGIFASMFGVSTSGTGTAPASGTPQAQGSPLDNLTKMFQPGSLPAEIAESGLPEQIGKILSQHAAS
jgi:hypothetical protein